MPAQRLRRTNVVQMLYKCFVFAGLVIVTTEFLQRLMDQWRLR